MNFGLWLIHHWHWFSYGIPGLTFAFGSRAR